MKKLNPQLQRLLAYSVYTIVFSLAMRGVQALTMDDVFGGIRNGLNSVASGGRTQAQPVPVPSQPAPTGYSSDCATTAYTPPPQVEATQPAPVRSATKTYWDAGGKALTDRRAITLFNLAQGTTRKSVNDRLGMGIRQIETKWRPNAILIEDKANGPAIIERLSRELSGVIAVNPEGGKIARATAVSPLVEAKNIFLPEDESWLADFVAEFAAFPSGTHDDQVDAMSQALNWMSKRGFGDFEYESIGSRSSYGFSY